MGTDIMNLLVDFCFTKEMDVWKLNTRTNQFKPNYPQIHANLKMKIQNPINIYHTFDFFNDTLNENYKFIIMKGDLQITYQYRPYNYYNYFFRMTYQCPLQFKIVSNINKESYRIQYYNIQYYNDLSITYQYSTEEYMALPIPL